MTDEDLDRLERAMRHAEASRKAFFEARERGDPAGARAAIEQIAEEGEQQVQVAWRILRSLPTGDET